LRDPKFSQFDTILACVRQMEGQTDGQTQDNSIHRASIVLHDKNQSSIDKVGPKIKWLLFFEKRCRLVNCKKYPLI